MSYVITAPEMVTAAAGNLAGIGSTIGQATAAAAAPTTSVAAAAADDVSLALSQMFGTYGQEFQALSAQAAAFHNQFVSLMNGGASAYLGAEIANVQQGLATAPTSAAVTDPLTGALSGVTAPAPAPLNSLISNLTAAAPILPGLPNTPTIPGPTLPGLPVPTPTLPGLPGLPTPSLPSLPGLPAFPNFSALLGGVGPALSGFGQAITNGLAQFAPGATQAAMQIGDPWADLFTQTGSNLQSLGAGWAADPFPVLKQVMINQGFYAQEFGTGVLVDLQGFPGNVPTNVQLTMAGASTFNPAALGQTFIGGTGATFQTIGTSLQNAGADFQTTGPKFEYDMGLAGTAISQGNYHGAVQDGAHAVLDLFITGFNTTDLNNIQVTGPAGDLLPILSLPANQLQGLTDLMPPGSIPRGMAQNFTNLIGTLTSSHTSTTFTVPSITDPTATIGASAMFGLPLSLGFAALGPPFAMLDGVATGATVFGDGLVTGNGVMAAAGLIDMPAYALNGLLNGTVDVNLSLPVPTAVIGSALITGLLGPLGPILSPILGPVTAPVLELALGPTVPISLGLPFEGILVPPQSVSATINLSLPVVGNLPPITLPLGGTTFGGLLPTLVNYAPQKLAGAVSYQNTGQDY
jgi:hypothetical protein